MFLAIGSPGGRTIINTVLEVIVNVVDFGMNVQEAIDAPRFHHQWLPDRILRTSATASPRTPSPCCGRAGTRSRRARGTRPPRGWRKGWLYDAAADMLEGGSDRRAPDGAAIGR